MNSKYVIWGIAGLALLVLVIFISKGSDRGFGGATSGLAAAFASSTAQVAGATDTTISATSSDCTSRSISTTGKGIMLTFDDSKTPTGLFGTWQAASTTTVYDSGNWGCGLIRALSQDAASSVTVNVFR